MNVLQLLGSIADIGTLDWIVCLGYLLLVVSLGLWFSHDQSSNDDFFLGGRNMHWMPVGLSLFATTMSSNSFVGLPAEGAFENYHQLLAILFIPFVIIPIVCYWFIPFYKRMGSVSLYEYLERRFNRKVRLFASGVFMFYSAGWMATMLLAVSRILEVVLETDSSTDVILMIILVGALATLYTAVGGVKAVIWTDTIQAFALGGGLFVLLFYIVSQIDGGWHGMLAEGMESDKFEMFSLSGGWGERNFYSACAYGFVIYLGAQIATYGGFQRYVTVDTISDARRSLYVKGLFTLFACTLFFLVGTALYVFYQQSVETRVVFDSLAKGKAKDQLLPHFVVHYATGFGMTGLLLAGLFAAAMSSLDSGINSMTASFVTDWRHGKEVGVAVNRICTLVFGIIVTAAAVILVHVDSPVFDILLAIAGASFGLLLSVLLLGMFCSRANVVGVTVGMSAGVGVFCFVRLYTKFASTDALLWMGTFAEIKNNTWWDGLFTTVTALTVGLGVSYLTKPPPIDKLGNLLLLTERRNYRKGINKPRD
ncbi:MAG: sodium/solute symporter [Planctomycetaceae bacterium]|nr:sodium/solute symporter [Planctomycetaceae bacterium]MBT4010814.1 sodium/solute symporter [Planctomycetaceae bacterium]MBT4724866.1 sodium/solute symporter [Planctomycetaceae bacterium]MBT5123514.1 sodium/solute symporter [Planctomycetaceae bacterium]MBT5599087.1 sodium/solute symporter [Planctomycetaceae bacterium]